MRLILPVLALAAGLSLTACQPEAGEFDPPVRAQTGSSSETTSAPATNTAQVEVATGARMDTGPLPDFFDCVRESGGMLIASHRGGPAPGYPENAIETLQYGLDQGILVHEIDVAESRDGVLFLMHDRTLGRTTTGGGYVADTDWDTIERLNLVDDEGSITAFTAPKLSEVLLWAKRSGAIVELDKKETTSFRNIISHVRAAEAEQNVILITYNDDQAREVARLAPGLMMTAGVDSRSHQETLEAAGVNFDQVIAWMGISNPNPRAFEAVGRRGVETAFGTLGRPGERLDDQYWADGDPSEYQTLADGGLTMLATDAPYRVAEALTADEIAYDSCLKR
ncbi:MAG: glycerophosphodiester phosphodiesterase family protein [Henriciella sp.]|nr:glycerophosphodiester phosphodiesterase family protein [Henriciella sp.]